MRANHITMEREKPNKSIFKGLAAVQTYLSDLQNSKPDQLSEDQILELDDARIFLSAVNGISRTCLNFENAVNSFNAIAEIYKTQLMQEGMYRHI